MAPDFCADPSHSRQRTIGSETDRSLIEGLRSGDEADFLAVYDAYAGIAYGIALRILGSSPEAEDVVQDAFLALWRQAERLEPQRGIRSYLLTMVHHKAVDRLRASGRRPQAPLADDMPLPDPAPGPEETAERRIEAASVQSALASLPAEQLQAIQMTYFAGMTINEVAKRTNVPLGTVKSRLRLALGRLRGLLDESR